MNVGMFDKVKDFLKNDDFLRFVLGKTSEEKAAWRAFEKEHPDVQPLSDEAEAILLSSFDGESELSSAEVKELKERIFNSLGLKLEL